VGICGMKFALQQLKKKIEKSEWDLLLLLISEVGNSYDDEVSVVVI
jgi:hypothetical protein